MSKNVNIQDVILNKVRKENIVIDVCLVNGGVVSGLVKGFDSYVILMEVKNKHQMIYKHSVVSIIPHKFLENLN